MKGRTRVSAVLSIAVLLGTTFGALIGAPVAATAGRDSAATAADATDGFWNGATGPLSNAYVNPNPLAEDWYKIPVYPGQIFQATLFGFAGMRITVYHQAGCGATSCPSILAQTQAGNDCGGLGQGDIALIIWMQETLYIKISPAANPVQDQGYNLAVRAYNATEITTGTGASPPLRNESIHGWSIPVFLAGGPCGSAGTLWLPQRYTSDFYWINVSDALGPSHQNYNVQLSWTCQTAMYDLLLYQIFDPQNQAISLLNHSLSYARWLDRGALITTPLTMAFSPTLYDGRYLAQVVAVENGTFQLFDGAAAFNYNLSVTATGGYQKDGNDRRETGVWANTSGKMYGRIDGRDDNGDWFQLTLNQGEDVSISVRLMRELNQINLWGQRYRALLYAPNGTILADETNWGYGSDWFFNDYITIPTTRAQANGTFSLLLMAADGGLNYRTGNDQPALTGYTGRNWADYEVNFILPNRRPVQLVSPLPDLPMDEDGQATVNLYNYFQDPEAKYGYPTFTIGSSANFTFALDSQRRNLTAIPKPDYHGTDRVLVTVGDDLPSNSFGVWLNLTVFAINDAPRVYPWAGFNWTTVTVPEDAETNVPLRSIFFDVDDLDLNYTVSGTGGGHLNVSVNDVSKIVNIKPFPNWNGCQDLLWTARDPAGLTATFTTSVCVSALNDPPRATDKHLDRIVFNEGGEQTVDLSNEFFDLDAGDVLYYYGVIDDPIVAQHVRINNSLLSPTDPYMRVYVLDADRADYFTDGPVQVRFMVFDRPISDPFANWNPATGQQVQVEKTAFLEVLNVNDAPFVDGFTPTPEEVELTEWREGDTITFSVTDVKDPDHEQQFFYKWYVNDVEVPQEVSPTFVFRTVLDQTRPGQYDAGHYSVRVQVFDAAQAKAILEPTWTFDVLKTNRRPTVTVLRPTSPTFEEGAPIQFQALAADEDPEDAGSLNTTWSYTDAAGQRHQFAVDDSTSRYLDPGVYEITVSVFDGTEYSNQTITVTVTEHRLSTPGFASWAGALAMAGAAIAMAAARRRKWQG